LKEPIMMTSKITDQHLSRVACIYIRQSTPGQVRFNQESTERQYNLKNKAQALGWSPSGHISAQRRKPGRPYAITITDTEDRALCEWVATSSRISPTQTA
jgi:hypothetical protein